MNYATEKGDRFIYVGPDTERRGKIGTVIKPRDGINATRVKWDDGRNYSTLIGSDWSLQKIEDPPKTRLQELMDQYKETRVLHEKAKQREASAKRERELLDLKKQNLRNELLREIDNFTKPE